uniref:Uncharacterized protein n=1 Tax=Rhodopseudomonas palustris (strain BisA53) TaxID=316055 RepID=Q07HU8_RHOP5
MKRQIRPRENPRKASTNDRLAAGGFGRLARLGEPHSRLSAWISVANSNGSLLLEIINTGVIDSKRCVAASALVARRSRAKARREPAAQRWS